MGLDDQGKSNYGSMMVQEQHGNLVIETLTAYMVSSLFES